MTEETRHIYLFVAFGGAQKYTCIYDEMHSIPSDKFYVSYIQGKAIDMTGKHLVFTFKNDIKTEADEKRLRMHDVFCGAPCFIFVNDRIMNCMSHLVGKDIQVLPAEVYTKNGLVKGYHLINIINTVHGVDWKRSTCWDSSNGVRHLEKLVPKNEDFMGGHEIAREAESIGWIYVTPFLREKILKSKKGKLKGLELRTTKEDWEAGHTEKYPY